MVFVMSDDKFCICFENSVTGSLKAEWQVTPPIRKAAFPDGAHNKTHDSSFFFPGILLFNKLTVWSIDLMKVDFPVPAAPVRISPKGNKLRLKQFKT